MRRRAVRVWIVMRQVDRAREREGEGMKKYAPSHDLAAFQRYWTDCCKNDRMEGLFTTTAYESAVRMQFDLAEWSDCILSMRHEHFRESMTSYRDHRQWQDVYIVPWDGLRLYVKFTNKGVQEFTLLSFKEE